VDLCSRQKVEHEITLQLSGNVQNQVQPLELNEPSGKQRFNNLACPSLTTKYRTESIRLIDPEPNRRSDRFDTTDPHIGIGSVRFDY
jgi:hypothetical protein